MDLPLFELGTRMKPASHKPTASTAKISSLPKTPTFEEVSTWKRQPTVRAFARSDLENHCSH
jgi:hypothetical protein